MYMKLYLPTLVICLFALVSASAQVPKTPNGRVQRFENVTSKYVQTRNVDVWLPEGYDSTKRYPVLYMHDGQMLYDSTATWNKQEWHVDEVLSALFSAKKAVPCIVVGVWNAGEFRHSNYFPKKPLDLLPPLLRDSIIAKELKGEAQADKYLLFLTQELKPMIDRKYRTRSDRAHTFIMGSSMGGLISMYAMCEYPDVFGGAACISTHWIGSVSRNNPLIPNAFNQYMLEHLPSAKTHRIYFDFGTKTIDAYYEPYQKIIDETMKKRGYTDKNWKTLKFEGEDHSEKSWSKRLDIPMTFLLRK
jgi:predicted alpha/beta superfamily hydrolase